MFSRYATHNQCAFILPPVLEYDTDNGNQPPAYQEQLSAHYYDTSSALAKYVRREYNNNLPFPFPVPIFDTEEQLYEAAKAAPPLISPYEVQLDDVLGYAGVFPIFRCETPNDLAKVYYQLKSIVFNATFVYYSPGAMSPTRQTTRVAATLERGIRGSLNTDSWNMDPVLDVQNFWDTKDHFASKLAAREEQGRSIYTGTANPVFYKWRNPSFTYFTAPNIEYGMHPSAMPYLSMCGVVQVGKGYNAVYFILGSPYITGGSFYYGSGRPIAALGGKPAHPFYVQYYYPLPIDEGITTMFSTSRAKYYYGSQSIEYIEFENPAMEFIYSNQSELF